MLCTFNIEMLNSVFHYTLQPNTIMVRSRLGIYINNEKIDQAVIQIGLIL